MELKEKAPFSVEIYAREFKSDFFKSEDVDPAVTGEEIKNAFDQDVEKVVYFMTWRWDAIKRRMVPIVDSLRKAKISIAHGRRIGLKDYDVSAEVVEVYDQPISAGQDYYNGNVIVAGAELEFHWSEIAGWGSVYTITKAGNGEIVHYQPTKNYTVPDALAPTFRLCDPKRDGYVNAADLMQHTA